MEAPTNNTSFWSRRPHQLWPAYGLLVLAFGLYLGLNAFISIRRMGSTPAWEPFCWEISSVVVIAALIPLVVRLESHVRIDSHPRWRALGIHAAAAVLFSIIHTTGMVLLRKLTYAAMGGHYDFGSPLLNWFYELQKDLLTYVVIMTAIFAVREFRIRRAGELRATELAAELSEARLRHLTAQIEPHFLFNTLNAISNRMHEDVAAADRMISQLGDLLRAAYQTDRDVLVPLGHELGWLRGYAAMMAERFRGQLDIQIQVQPDLERVEVPRLLLQPLVENAIRHGLGDGRGSLRIEVVRQGDRLQYTVTDDGTGFSDRAVSHGTGLTNISRRLQLLFPGKHTLDLASRAPRGAVVTVSFPVAG